MKKLTIITLFLLNALIMNAQQANQGIAGKVTSNQNPFANATISLLKAKDSSIVKIGTTDKTGNYLFENIKNGQYLILVTAVGYNKIYSQHFVYPTQDGFTQVPELSLTVANKELQNVTVTNKKPFIEHKIDKLVVNIDASPSNIGTTAMEVLEKSPGITVDKDGNISLKGKGGVMVMLDGKPSYMNSADLANFLRGLPSSQLESFEIMTNPPAKFDASGNAGVINIKTKRTMIKGFNGNISSSITQGQRTRTNQSIGLNYRKNKLNIYTNYSFNLNNSIEDLNLNRNFLNETTNKINSTFAQLNEGKSSRNGHNLKLGVDLFATKKTTYGIVLSAFSNVREGNMVGTTLISNAQNILQTRTQANSYDKNKWNNALANFNIRHKFDSTGTEITADFDFASYNKVNDQMLSNLFYDNAGLKKSSDEFIKGDLPTDIKIYSAKFDYVKPLKKDAKFEAGAKSSFVTTDNNAQYFVKFDNGSYQVDNNKTNHFIYKENINAAYVNYSKKLNKKWSSQLGLRLENTISTGDQATSNQSFKRNYTQLFPTAYLSYEANKKNQFTLNYGRRINRPDYDDLNPFFFFLDKYTFKVGNSFLKPEFTHNIELSHSYNNWLNTTINYSNTTDIIQDVIQQTDSTNTTFLTSSNIAKRAQIGIAVNAGFAATKWWRTNIYTNAFYNNYAGFVNKAYISVKAPGFMVNVQNNFTFKKGWGAELSGFYRGKQPEGILNSLGMGRADIAVSKQVMKGKGTVKFAIRDFLNIQEFNGYSKYQNVDITINAKNDTRQVNIGFNYRFGKPIKGNPRQRNISSSEQNRVNSN